MPKSKKTKSKSAFDDQGLHETIRGALDEIKTLYLSDDIPWVVGYSGGKDSTAVLQLVWLAIAELDEPRWAGRHAGAILTDLSAATARGAAVTGAGAIRIGGTAHRQGTVLTGDTQPGSMRAIAFALPAI